MILAKKKIIKQFALMAVTSLLLLTVRGCRKNSQATETTDVSATGTTIAFESDGGFLGRPIGSLEPGNYGDAGNMESDELKIFKTTPPTNFVAQ